MEPPEIRKLDVEVINRIAAGEIIQRPANALKELIENSLDAKSTNIQITVKNGGLKLLQIQDNGTGIRKEDFEILCERFTTSKLREFEDLHKLITYGFRGEALASISHIAHLTVTSKTKNDICAYQASFVDGKLQGVPKPTAGNQGTIITVEDLFYNMTVRKKALRSPAEEYQKISEVVCKYAIHNSSVGFALKKSGGNNDVRTPVNSTQIENIKIIYGNAIARELIEFSLTNEPFKFKLKGFITNVNYSTKKFQFLLFINNRLVDCHGLKKCIDQVYSTYLPNNAHSFVYLSLELDPGDLDVNIHPTKHEVRFLNEDQIIETIATALETKLLGSNNSRVFFTQAKLPKVFTETAETLTDAQIRRTNPKDFVRTDSKEQKLEKFFGCPIKKDEVKETTKAVQEEKPNPVEVRTNPEPMNLDVSLTEEEFQKQHELFVERNEKFEDLILNKTDVSPQIEEMKIIEKPVSKNEHIVKAKEPDVSSDKKNDSLSASFISKITRVETKLTSVLQLRKEVEDNCHKLLRETFAQHVFVGPVNPAQALIQSSTKLYLCNTELILSELFYQFILYNFQNFACYRFSNKFSVAELALICLELPEAGWTPEDGDKEELAKRTAEILTDKGPMLQDYFSMEIDEYGNLCSIPILLDNYVPDPAGLPMYILRLATEVNWEEEKECFRTFAKETARFHAQVSTEAGEEGKDWKWVTEHVVYPAVKDFFIPPKSFTENAAILEIASLPNLYKVFERC
ncbi:hypothetical protein NQ315_002390 [Exocentrus adspersus]|uniref:DNA mismatch repair protein S5 domain-containing protein n=1 Tax=Exocentrus adspersus TaxID=1586481 RepID=A0AAV8VUH3_9CUCU|nr:hypothetical protein NQ315_002390 [Exocentrus adspersus]